MSALPNQLASRFKVKMHKGVKAEQHSIYPVSATGNTEFSYGNQNTISFMIPAYKRGFFNPKRSQFHFHVKTPTGVMMADGIPIINRMVLRSGNGQVLEDIQQYSAIDRALKNFESIVDKHANSARIGDYRVPKQTGASNITTTQLKELYTNGTTVEHDLRSSILGKSQEHYIPVGLFNASGGYAFELMLYLEDPKIACVKDADAPVLNYTLTECTLQMEIVTMNQEITDKIDASLYEGGKVSIPYSQMRLHQSYVPANSQQVELSISEAAHDLECVYSLIRKQNLNADARLTDTNYTWQGIPFGDNLSFLGGHLDRTKDAAASTNSELLGAIANYQFRYDTMYLPAKRAEMSAKDTKLALINAVHSLDAVDKAVFASSTLSTGKSLWDQGGVCAIVQSFKSARDGDKLSGLNSSATGAPLELSLAFKKPQAEALRVEHFVKSNYTLNIERGGRTTIINGANRDAV